MIDVSSPESLFKMIIIAMHDGTFDLTCFVLLLRSLFDLGREDNCSAVLFVDFDRLTKYQCDALFECREIHELIVHSFFAP
jgi:hypothetical protein